MACLLLYLTAFKGMPSLLGITLQVRGLCDYLSHEDRLPGRGYPGPCDYMAKLGLYLSCFPSDLLANLAHVFNQFRSLTERFGSLSQGNIVLSDW